MGFHPHFARVLGELFTNSNVSNAAFLGDQEVILQSGDTSPLDAFLLNLRPASTTVFEHPGQQSRSNKLSHWRFIDLSNAVADDFKGYDLIIDGGTLEHVANMATVFCAMWQGLSKGGYFVGGYPVNNLCDHGYWMPQPRFFSDFFRRNQAEEVRIQIVHFAGEDGSASLRIMPYSRSAAEQMHQPQWAWCEGQVGVFMIARKSLSSAMTQALLPSEFW